MMLINVYYVQKIVKCVIQIKNVFNVLLDITCYMVLVLQIVINIIMLINNIKYVNNVLMVV